MAMAHPYFEIKLTYCAPCGYTPRVLALTQEILSDRNMEYFIADWKLVPDSGGKFEFEVNGELVFSKKGLGRHAEEGEIKALLQAKIDAFKQEKGITWENVPEAN